mmetsp:Transcript_100153/g.283586  ORF Transcript_100153/g.283586 Transcript_100153/m.283586 type:complete len:765 (+) Transcript_100153:49-2343(+)
MGIQGLLPFLRSYVQRANIKEYKGKTVGVDAMCWMHKGAFACSKELVLGQDTDKFIYFFIKHCEIMRCAEVKPVIVFDGAKLPAKAKEERHRKDVREKARSEALELLERRSRGEDVPEHLIATRCEAAIRVTGAMISRLMGALRELSIHFIVAPFEADAQLAYMCRIGWVHAVISEDSDLLAYGCPNTFFKMDKFGDGERITLPCLQPRSATALPPAAAPSGQVSDAAKRAGGGASSAIDVDEGEPDPPDAPHQEGAGGKKEGGEARGRRGAKAKQKGGADGDEEDASTLDTWTPEVFVELCVFAGTDYKEPDVHIKGFGLKTAYKLLCQHREAEKVISWMYREKRWKDKFSCSVDEYMVRFRSVVAVFWHHNVFDPRRGECVSISASYPNMSRELPGIDLEAHCGVRLAKKDIVRVVRGDIDPHSHAERQKEPLTPAERAVLNRIIARTRDDQREFAHQRQLREDANRITEARERDARAAAEHAAAAAESAAAGAPPHAAALANPPVQTAQAAPAEAEPPEGGDEGAAGGEDVPKPEMCLLPGDIAAILAVQDNVAQAQGAAKLQSPPKMTQGEAVQLQLSNPFNPFARKRVAPAMGGDCAVLSKKAHFAEPRTGERQGTQPSQRQGVPSAGGGPPHAADANASDVVRHMATPQMHPRGGFAASDAVKTVLAQMGAPEVEELTETRNRGKLGFFFKMAPRKADQGKEAPPQAQGSDQSGSKLASWQAQPWAKGEAEEENPFKVNRNVLSIKGSNRFIPFHQRS